MEHNNQGQAVRRIPTRIRLSKRTRRVIAFVSAAAVLALLLLWGAAHLSVQAAARDRCFDDAASVAPHRAALVLGCAKTTRAGFVNRYFAERIAAAVELYEAGKVEYLIVSGDNRHRSYDEPTGMRRALVASGIPPERIYCDYAGFRTLDSVVRAKEVFGEDTFIIVTQPFHAPRALFLAQAAGAEAVALYAGGPDSAIGPRTRLREELARVLAFIDVYLLHTEPKFYGPAVPLGPPQSVTTQ